MAMLSGLRRLFDRRPSETFFSYGHGFYKDPMKNAMLNAVSIDSIRLHSGNPGDDGLANAVSDCVFVSFGCSTQGKRQLLYDVVVEGMKPNQPVSFISIWGESGTVFRCSIELDGGIADRRGRCFIQAFGLTLSLS
jgi:hypothetical protein